MYPWITKDIQESFHTLKISKTLKTLNQINQIIKTYMKVLLFFIDEASSSILVKKFATHYYEK